MKLQPKWSASGTKSSVEFFTAKISFQSNVSSLKYIFHYLFPLWISFFVMCLSKASNESQKRRCCCFYVLKAKQDLCRFLVHRPGQSVVTNYGFPPKVHFNSLVKSSPVIIVLAGKIESPHCMQRRYLWLNVIFHVFSWNQLWHLLHVCGQESWQQYWRDSTVSRSKASAAVLFGKESLVSRVAESLQKNDFAVGTSHTRGFCSSILRILFCISGDLLIPVNHRQKLFFFSFWYTVLHSWIQICSLYDKRNLTESVSAVEISIFC